MNSDVSTSAHAGANALVAFRATLEDTLNQEVRKVADTATEEDLALVKDLTTPTETYSAALVTVTPAVAALLYLDHNAHNRDFRVTTGREYGRRMKDGEWKQNNATYGLYKDGNLEDAQHRLVGQALSGQTLNVVIVRGIDKSAIATIDDGAARHGSDAAQLDGVLDAKRKQAVVKGAATYNVRNGDKAAALLSEYQIAEAIRVNDGTLIRAIGLADGSVAGITKPYLKGNQAAVLAYLFLNNGWPEDLVRKHLSHMQAGASSNENDKEPRFLGMDYITRARESKARADRLSGIKELGIMVFTIVEAQKGTKALARAKIREAVKTGQMPDPHYPGDAPAFSEAAE